MRGRTEVVVGMVIVAAVIVLIGGTLWLQGARFAATTIVVQAGFREVGQLRPGNDVKLRGVSVGRVESIAVTEAGDAVLVTLRIDQDLVLPEDPVVLLSPESMFGDWQAEFAPRSQNPRIEFHDLGDPEVLPGYAIPDISQLTLQAERIANNLNSITDRIEVAFTEETANNIREAIDNIEEVSQTLNELVQQQGQAVTEVTEEVRRTAEEVGAAAESARMAFETMDSAMATGDMVGLMSDARVTVANLRTVSDELAASSDGLVATVVQADSALSSVARIAARVERGEGSLGRLLVDSTFAVEAENLLRTLDLLLQDFQENPKKYVRLSIF